MMIKFKMKPEAAWVRADDEIFDSSELGDYPKDERAKIKFLIYPLTASLLREVRDNYTSTKNEMKFVDGRRVVEKVDKTDENAVNDELLNRIILDWEGVPDVSGKPIPCNKKNKADLADAYQGIGVAWIEASRQVMAKHEQYTQEEKEVQEKNSGTSQDGARKEPKK